MLRQEDDFRNGEGDAWYRRTRERLDYSPTPNQMELVLISSLPFGLRNSSQPAQVHFVEVGCSRGDSLSRIQKETGFTASGIDPSQLAIAEGQRMFGDRMRLSLGTATETGLENASVDILFFGWCLMYVEPAQLPKVFKEIKRVLKTGGVLVIFDFDYLGPGEHLTPYKHLEGLFSYRRNYTTLCHRHGFSLISKTPFVSNGEVIQFCDTPSERLALQVFVEGEHTLPEDDVGSQ